MEHVLGIIFKEGNEAYLSDISSILYDIELAHDFAVIVSNRHEYRNYRFTQHFWYRNGRPIKDEHKIRIARMRKESPFFLEVIIPSLGALWVVIQIFDKVWNMSLNREKLILEIGKLRAEELLRREKVMSQTFDEIYPEEIMIEQKIESRLSKLKLKANKMYIGKDGW